MVQAKPKLSITIPAQNETAIIAMFHNRSLLQRRSNFNLKEMDFPSILGSKKLHEN